MIMDNADADLKKKTNKCCVEAVEVFFILEIMEITQQYGNLKVSFFVNWWQMQREGRFSSV